MGIRILRECGILFLCVLQISSGKQKKEKYCDYTKNVYYSEPMGGCKKCDPCFIGWGLVDNIDFDIDSEKGALGCRVCRKCEDGFFQKRYRAFKKCKECKVCRVPGQYEVRKCTATQNRKCRNIKHGEEDTLPTISKSSQEQHLMTTGNIPIQKFPVPAPFRQSPIETPSSTPKTQALVVVKGFHEYKTAFIVMAVVTTAALTLVFVVIFRWRRVKKKHAQQTASEETIEDEQGQRNADDDFEASRTRDPNTEKTAIEESENKRKEDTLAVCKHNRSKERCQKLDSSIPLLQSAFRYNLSDTTRVSNLNGIKMVSENITSISDVSDSERCDNLPSGLGASDVTDDGSSFCHSDEDEKHLTGAELQRVAHRLAPAFYKKVGRELGVDDNEIRIIQANLSDVEEISYEVLKKWTEKKAPLATKKTLKDALVKVGRGDVVATFYNAKDSQKP